jgi:hypothetical protein
LQAIELKILRVKTILCGGAFREVSITDLAARLG